jgi:hypothetical protein
MEFHNIATRIHDLLGEVDSADIRVPEDSALISLAADLVPTVHKLLEDGIQLMRDIEEAYGTVGLEEDLEEDDPFSLKGIGFLISSVFASRDLTDLAFFAHTELRECLDVLGVTAKRQNLDLESVASYCEAGTRRLRKALISVESAIYEFEQREAPIRKWFDVEVSLQIRKLYWNLRRETMERPGDDKRLTERLRSVVYRLVAFRELSVYPLLRIDDRIQLRALLKRILEWLNNATRNDEDGLRLWQDLVGFAEILVQISQRQELQEHDRALVAQSLRRLFRQQPPPQSVPDEMLDELESLLGVDEDIDRLILGRHSQVSAWRAPLLRVNETLNRPEEPIASVDLWTE